MATKEEKVLLCSVCEKIDLKPILFSEDHPEDHPDCWEGDELNDSEKVYELSTGDVVASRASSCELCRFLLQRIKWFFRNDPILANFQALTCSLNWVRYGAPIPTNRPVVARLLCVTRYRLDLCMKYEMRFYKIATGDAHYFRFIEIPSILQPSF